MNNLKIKLMSIEEELDKLNGDYANKEHYCIFCGSNIYNEYKGIVHKRSCIIQQIRNKIKDLNK